MKGSPRAAGLDPRHLVAAALGALFAASLYQVWSLQGRWFAIAILVVFLVSAAIAAIQRLGDFVLVSFLFALPLSGFVKWFLLERFNEDVHSAAPFSGALGLGLSDFMLIGLYLSWFGRVFATREERPPRLEKIDGIVLVLVSATALSVWGAPSPLLGLSALEHLVKHVLVYFYVSRNLQRRHLGWLLGAMAFAIFVESALGIYQNRTGLLQGVALDKGAGGAELNYAYEVPGIEQINRATGTCYDSHSFGLYMCMLLPFAWISALERSGRRWARVGWSALFLTGGAVLALSYSRSAWISFAITLVLGVVVLLSVWREFHALPAVLLGLWVAILAAPLAFATILLRFQTAPGELLSARFEQWEVAWKIFLAHPLFGVGAGNYMTSLATLNLNWALELPVHNVALFLAAEVGLVAVIAFFGLKLAALLRLWKAIRVGGDTVGRIALAVAVGLVAYTIDGLTDPLFREPVVYMMFWVSIGLSVALPRIAREEQRATAALA